MGDVYDFKTGQLCKCCTHCNYWKGVIDFPSEQFGKYGVGPVCCQCLATRQPEGDMFNFTLDNRGGCIEFSWEVK